MRFAAMVVFALGAFQEQDITSIESVAKAPARTEGTGPYERLFLRGVTLIDGSGAPPVGPVDIVIARKRIGTIQSVGYPDVPIEEAGRPKAEPGDEELDLEGMYVSSPSRTESFTTRSRFSLTCGRW